MVTMSNSFCLDHSSPTILFLLCIYYERRKVKRGYGNGSGNGSSSSSSDSGNDDGVKYAIYAYTY